MNTDTATMPKHASIRSRIAILLLVALAIGGCKGGAPVSTAAPATGETAAVSPRDSARSGASENERQGRRRSRRGRADTQAAPGAFDFYLFNLSWSPEFCATHSGSPECNRGLGFVVHGMWPQDLSGDYPEDCSDAPGPANPQAYTDMIPTASLVEHEWQTHGTCSGLTADAYFGAIRKAFAALKIPASIGAGSDGRGVSPDNLISRFAQANPRFPRDSFAISCGNNRLTALEICLSRNLQPESCQGVRSCRAAVISVTSR